MSLLIFLDSFVEAGTVKLLVISHYLAVFVLNDIILKNVNFI